MRRQPTTAAELPTRRKRFQQWYANIVQKCKARGYDLPTAVIRHARSRNRSFSTGSFRGRDLRHWYRWIERWTAKRGVA